MTTPRPKRHAEQEAKTETQAGYKHTVYLETRIGWGEDEDGEARDGGECEHDNRAAVDAAQDEQGRCHVAEKFVAQGP